MTEIGIQPDAPMKYLLQRVLFHSVYDGEKNWALAGKSIHEVTQYVHDTNSDARNQSKFSDQQAQLALEILQPWTQQSAIKIEKSNSRRYWTYISWVRYPIHLDIKKIAAQVQASFPCRLPTVKRFDFIGCIRIERNETSNKIAHVINVQLNLDRSPIGNPFPSLRRRHGRPFR